MGENRMDLKTLHDTPPWEWPEDAGEMFLEILRDERADKSERLLAAELAGDSTVIDDELADALMSILLSGHEPEDLRARAVISLGPALEYADIDGFDDPEYVPISEQTFIRIQKTLRKLYMDAGVPKEVRRRILEASVRAPQDWHRDAVRAAYSSDDEDWRLTAVFCMRFVRGFEERILQSLDSRNPDIHYEAVCAAGNWEIDAAWSHIAGLVIAEDTDKSLLFAAIEAAASIRPHEASEILVELIESDDEDIVEAAYDALGMAEALAVEGWDEDNDDNDDDDDDEFLH
jgi:HEAT repeat protein